MDSALAALIGVVVGVFGNNFAGEYYKRHRDRCSLASGLAGEIQATIIGVEQGGLLLSAPHLILAARQNREVNLPPLPAQRDFVYENSVGHIGLFGGDVPERLALYYGYLKGSRRLIELISEDFFGKTGEGRAVAIESLVKRWNETIGPLGKQLVVDLKIIGGKRLPQVLRDDFHWGSKKRRPSR